MTNLNTLGRLCRDLPQFQRLRRRQWLGLAPKLDRLRLGLGFGDCIPLTGLYALPGLLLFWYKLLNVDVKASGLFLHSVLSDEHFVDRLGGRVKDVSLSGSLGNVKLVVVNIVEQKLSLLVRH